MLLITVSTPVLILVVLGLIWITGVVIIVETDDWEGMLGGLTSVIYVPAFTALILLIALVSILVCFYW